VGFDELAALILDGNVYGILIGVVLTYMVIWFTRRTWRTFRRTREPYQTHGITPIPGVTEDDIPEPEWRPEDVDVYVNGLLQQPGEDYGVSPDLESIAFELPLRQRDVIQLRARDLRQVETLEEDLPAGGPIRIQFEPLPPPIVIELPKVTVGEDGWVKLLRPDVTLKPGDPVTHEGKPFVVMDIHQAFNPAGHFTYAQLKPWKPPRTRWERMLDDELDY